MYGGAPEPQTALGAPSLQGPLLRNYYIQVCYTCVHVPNTIRGWGCLPAAWPQTQNSTSHVTGYGHLDRTSDHATQGVRPPGALRPIAHVSLEVLGSDVPAMENIRNACQGVRLHESIMLACCVHEVRPYP